MDELHAAQPGINLVADFRKRPRPTVGGFEYIEASAVFHRVGDASDRKPHDGVLADGRSGRIVAEKAEIAAILG